MQEMQFVEAKARLSQVVDEVVSGAPVVITRHGRREAVLISWEAYDRMVRERPSFGWLLAHPPEGIADALGERDRTPARDVDL